jgi:hypothetical protein
MPPNADSVTVPIRADTAEFDEWVRSVRLLMSQIGFALDNYLASRPSPGIDQSNG